MTLVDVVQRLRFRRLRPPHDHHLDPEQARRLDLGIGRASAAVLGDEDLDLLVPHQREFVLERERPAREDQPAIGERARLGRRIDRPNDVAVLRRAGEGGELEPPLGQEHGLRRGAERVDRLLHRRDLVPAVAFLSGPWRAGEDDERRRGRAAGGKSVGRHARGEGMGRVDDDVDALGAKIGREALGTPEAADALRDRRRRRIGGRAGERQDGFEIRLAREAARQRARFRRSAEDEQANGLQGTAP